MAEQARLVPTGPGWWWRMGRNGPYIEEVDGDQNHAPFLAIDGSDVKDDGSWLAEIPDPLRSRLDALVTAMVPGEGCEGWFLPAEDVVARAVTLIRLIDGEVWRQATGDEEAPHG